MNKTSCSSSCNLSSNGATLSKVIATFCVVLTHSYKLFGYLNKAETDVFYLRGAHAFAACGVPVFFLLSGYFMMYKGNWNYTENLKKKVRSLLIPFCLFTLLYAIISCIGSLVLPGFFDDFRQFTIKDWLINLFGIPFVEGPHFYGPLWFVRDLLIFNLLSFALVPMVKKVPGFILLPLMVVLYFLPISQFIRYPIVFFISGMYFGFKKKMPLPSNKWVIVLLLAIGVIVSTAFVNSFTWKIAVLFMTILVLSVPEILVKNDKINNSSKRLIAYSFPVYLLHEYPMTTMMKVIARTHLQLPIYVIIFFIAPFIVIALCMLIIYLWKRALPKVYAVFVGGRQ